MYSRNIALYEWGTEHWNRTVAPDNYYFTKSNRVAGSTGSFKYTPHKICSRNPTHLERDPILKKVMV